MPERRFPGLRGLLPLLLAACLIAGSAEAATPFPSAFVVAGVPVDATAQNAVAARDAARLQGQRLAFRRLLERLTQQSDWSRLPSPGDDAITNLVQDFDVSDEHNSGVRYLASYTFRFKAASVRALLRGANIAESELASKLVVVLPVLVTSQGARPWNDDNPWHAAWAATSGRGGLVPWTVPAGDAADAAFDPANPAPAQLAALSARYGGGDIVVATATQNGGADQAGLDISISRYGPAGDATTTTTSVPPGKPDQSLYQAGVLAGQRELEEQWKKLSFSAGGTEASELEVSIPITGNRDWGTIEERLSKVPTIQSTEIELMSHSEVRLLLKIRGDANLLKLALAQQDLALGDGSPATLELRHKPTE